MLCRRRRRKLCIRNKSSLMKYKFNEDKLLNEVTKYVDNTYKQHYAQGNFQATEIIMDAKHGRGFCMGNIIKYAIRFDKKGDGREDLLKIIHYALLGMHQLDVEEKQLYDELKEYENQLYIDKD